MDDSHGWVTVQSSLQSPPLLSVGERRDSFSVIHSHTQLSVFPFLFLILPSYLTFTPLSLSRILVDTHSSCFCFLSHTHTHTCAHSHTGIWGIYRGVVELVMGLCFDAQWEITGPRSRDKSTTETQVSALAYALQTHSHIHLHTSITHVPSRPGMHTHRHTPTYTLTSNG